MAKQPISQAQVFASAFDAVAETAEEAANLKARGELMSKLVDVIHAKGWTQVQAARECKVSQPRVNDLLKGRMSRFSLDALVNIAAALGLVVHMELEAA